MAGLMYFSKWSTVCELVITFHPLIVHTYVHPSLSLLHIAPSIQPQVITHAYDFRT